NDAQRFGFVLFKTFDLEVLALLSTVIPRHPAAGEHVRIDDGAFDSRRNAQRGVPHLAGLFAENRTQQLFFGTELGFSFWCDLADQDISRPNFGTDADDATGVEILKRFLTYVRNVPGDFLGAELRVARATFELLDMY